MEENNKIIKTLKKLQNNLILVLIVGIITSIAVIIDVGEIFCKFTDVDLCKESSGKVEPLTAIELATKLLTGNNPAGLQIEILPSDILKVGEAMRVRLRSDYEGFVIVFDINHAGEFITLFPNEYSDQRQQGHLKVGQSLVIPDTYYGFDFEVQKSGQGILVAILVENGLTVVREVLPVPFVASSESSTRNILQKIRKRLDRTTRSDNGVEKSIRWSGIKIEYEIIAANGTIQE